jgi:nitrite reductase/ring-hydroxylating ferredoxin subunit
MSFIEVGQASEVPAGTMKSFPASGRQICIANVGGKLYAINNTCTHMAGDLSKGKLEGKIVTCPLHGSRFDVTTGKCLSGPAMLFNPPEKRDEPAFEVKVEGGKIRVDVAQGA